MDEECLQELAEVVMVCPPIEKQQEGYIFGLQRVPKRDSRMEWPQEVLNTCHVDLDDPIDVRAANNSPLVWRHILLSQAKAEYQAQYQRQESANLWIRVKLGAHYTPTLDD